MHPLSRLFAYPLTRQLALLRWLALLAVLLGVANPALAGKTYTDNLNGTVTDVTSGLTWMRCAVGQTWDGSTCTGATSVYTWEQAKALTGTVSFAGQSDWRLPTIRELQTLVDRSVFGPAIDSAAFPNMATLRSWAASADVLPYDYAWYVDFNDGNDSPSFKSDYFQVRLVRGGQPFGLLDISRPSTDYVDHANGTVTHTPTGLMWQTCAVGQTWSGGTCTGTASSFDWAAAQLLRSSLAAYSDWRLPTEDELQSLVDYSRNGPAMNATLFPNVPDVIFAPGRVTWSASTFARDSVGAWAVDFHNGSVTGSEKDGASQVRLVRAGQSFGSFGLDISKTGAGHVASSLPYLVCGNRCAGSFTAGTVVTLNATPAANFTSWGGACSGTAPTCSISMNAAQSVTASFLNTPLVSGLPDVLTFGPQNIGSSSAVQALTLSNPGTLPLAISSISATGDFAISHDCGASLGAGGSCTLNIRFTPSVSGLRTGTFSIISNAATSPNSIALRGIAQVQVVAKTYTDNGNGTVTDPTTGLIWMRCAMGQTWEGVATTCTGTARGYTWDKAMALTNTVTFARESDWRLPNIRELQTIVDRSVYSPAIDSAAFPNTPSLPFWSASANAHYSDLAWLVFFGSGNANYFYKTFIESFGSVQVRLVRGGQRFGLLDISRPSTDYVDHANGTVTHTPTGLMWQKCAVGQTWSGGTCTGTTSVFSWDAATWLSNSFASYSDWRLPTEDELLSLVDYSKYSPAINISLFPNTPSSSFWSASASAYYSDGAWYVHFDYGDVHGGFGKDNDFQVRFVRSGQSFGSFALNVSNSGPGQVNSSLGGIACGTQCRSNYTQGTVVTLNATPAAKFVNWGGACSGNTPTCSVSMDAAKSVSATFTDGPIVTGLPAALGFAATNVGSSSAAQSVTLLNTGAAPLNFSSFSASADFVATHNCGSGVGAGGSCSIDVSFKPLAYGSRSGTLIITDDAVGSPHSVALSGTGLGSTTVVVSPASLSFGTQNVGTTSAAKTLTLSNTGNLALTIGSISASAEFALTHNCGTGLDISGSCSLNVTFTPTVSGTRNGVISISSNAAGSPLNVQLGGTGAASGAPACTLAAQPARIQNGRSSTLTASCSPAATSYVWTGGNCVGNSTDTCSVTPTATTVYSVSGSNSFGASSPAAGTVTVKSVDLTPILMLLLD